MTTTISRPNDFQKDILLMQKMYLESERQFLDFNNIVPYIDNDDQVYSPRLVGMMQGIGPQIDGMLKIIAAIISIKPRQHTFPSYIEELDRKDLLSIQQIQLREDRSEILFPFRMKPENDNISWWKAYNKTKHQLPRGAYAGKYGNVINALAALASLHEIATAASNAGKYIDLVWDSKYWKQASPAHRGLNLLRNTFSTRYSNLFVYNLLFKPTAIG